MSFAGLLNYCCHLAVCWCVFILSGGGMGRWQTPAAESSISQDLCDRITGKCKIWWTPSRLTARMCLHMHTSWMWAFTEKLRPKIGLLHVLARLRKRKGKELQFTAAENISTQYSFLMCLLFVRKLNRFPPIRHHAANLKRRLWFNYKAVICEQVSAVIHCKYIHLFQPSNIADVEEILLTD